MRHTYGEKILANIIVLDKILPYINIKKGCFKKTTKTFPALQGFSYLKIIIHINVIMI